MTDSELIKLILDGDRDRFRILVEQHQQMVFRTCMGFVHNREDAEDLAQDVFVQAYRSLSGFKGESAFSTWIYRIAVNASLNKIRQSSRNSVFQRLDAFFGQDRNKELSLPLDSPENPEEILIKEEHAVWIRKALDSLPDNQKTAVILSKYDDLPQKEIAEIMNLTEGAVEALLQRAKKNLREKLSSNRKNK